VNANDLTVLGFVSGSVSARHVQLAPIAVAHADVLHERIAIEAGTELEGRLERRA
jgi:cytoskeletal protein CcmA (bactofilin family)